MDEDEVPISRVDRGNDEGMPVVHEADVADQSFVQDGVDGGLIVAPPLGVPAHRYSNSSLTFSGLHAATSWPPSLPPKGTKNAFLSAHLFCYNSTFVPIRHDITGATAAAIADSVETSVRRGRLAAGARIPPIRRLAEQLHVSPGTVASAYRTLRSRGVIVTDGRRGTRVRPRPPLQVPATPSVPDGVTNLSMGNPDPALLPALGPLLRRIDGGPRGYGGSPNHPGLLELAGRRLRSEGIPVTALTVVSGALDGVERVLGAHLSPGDRVAVEDPCYPSTLDLLAAAGLEPVPVPIDDRGPTPGGLRRALDSGADAMVLTPRAQNPTGAALDRARAIELRAILRLHRDVLVVEDDHAGPVSGAALYSLADGGRPRWAFVHSVSKSLGPDLRVAVVAGDDTTVARVEGRRLLGPGWVSYLLQQLVVQAWRDQTVQTAL